jgi:NhaP-type Na+/H+ or K+/H+ antiporter
VIATQLQDISGIVFLVSLSLWVLWPKKPGERMGRAWWSLPYSTNETRNTIASVTMLAWFVYMGARVGWAIPRGLLIVGGVSAAIALLVWVTDRRSKP